MVFSADDAARRATPPELAEQLEREVALGPEIFAWYRVSKDINYSGRDGSHLAVSLEHR